MKDKQHSGPDQIRHHVYDGIQEYDKRLPNWWLFTLYGAIVFATAYWAYYHWSSHMVPGYVRVEKEIEEYQKAALASGSAQPTDIMLWKLSRDPAAVASGEKIFQANCAACHGANLLGGIGPNLTDNVWIHGGNPLNLYSTVISGVLAKGMPVWGPVLGASRSADVIAYVISKNPTIQQPPEQ